MHNILSIYKFHFPFLHSQYEYTKKESFVSNLREFLLYEELSPKIEKKISVETEYITIYFLWWKFEILYYDTVDYFIPIFQLELFLEDNSILQEKLFHKIYNITRTLWKEDYIYDVDENFLSQRKEDVISIEDLKHNFSSFRIQNLENFIKDTQKEYLEEHLEANFTIKFAFMYMIYLCYIFYYNTEKLSKQKKELEEITGVSKFWLYHLQSDFTKTRLEHTKNLNIIQFRKYFEMLNSFFVLFEK